MGFVTGDSAPLPHRPDEFVPPPPSAPLLDPSAPEAANGAGAGLDEFDTIVRENRIRTVFQPIVSLADGAVFGYEALSRGPIGTRFESAEQLFLAAASRGIAQQLERVCRFRAIAGASSLPPGCYLFLNVSPRVLEERNAGMTRDILDQSRLAQERIVLEITEKQAIADFELLKRTLLHYNRQGFKVAIDDAGAGHSSLRAVTEVRPHFIKLDMALVRDIDRDRAKNALVSAIILFARRIDARVLAEGIETIEELATLIEIGVDLGQGFLLARPLPGFVSPKEEVAAFIRERSQASRTMPAPKRMAVSSITRRAPALMPSAYTSEVLEIFDRNPDLDSVVLTEYGAPVGLVSRTKLYERLSHPYGYSIFARRPVRLVMDDSYLAVDGKDSIDDVARKVIHRRRTEMYDEIVVLEHGVYSGIVSVRDLLHTMTEFQASMSRYANPLTGLPGRIPFQQEINRRIASASTFGLLHVDLKHFRSYNERHGFGRGDEIIRLVAECLVTVAKEIEGPQAMVGHLGGVNFLVLASEPNIEPLGLAVIARFDARAGALHVTRETPLLGLAEVRAPDAEVALALAGVSSSKCGDLTYSDMAARAASYKRMARSIHGNAFVLDGRVLGGGQYLPRRIG